MHNESQHKCGRFFRNTNHTIDQNIAEDINRVKCNIFCFRHEVTGCIKSVNRVHVSE